MSKLLDHKPEAGAGWGAGFFRVQIEWPLLIAAAFYLLSSFAILVAGAHLSDGHLVYPLDDVYIHMAVAKNVALRGVWGVTPYEFSSSSSSPVWVLALAACNRLVGVRTITPLLLSWLSGLASILVAATMLAPVRSVRGRTLALVAFVLFTPLYAVGLLGMEHALHLLLALLFLRTFHADTPLWKLALLTSVLCGTRYEGVLMGGTAFAVLLLQGRLLRALIVALSAWMPVGLYAWFSITHDGYWLPNSVAIKGIQLNGSTVAARLTEFATTAQHNVTRAPHLGFLLAAVIVATSVLYKRKPAVAAPLAVAAGAGILHLIFADVNWAFRYETYLVGCFVVLLAVAWPIVWTEHRRAAIATVCLLLPASAVLSLRSYLAATLLPHYSESIYLQQYQTARFLNTYYPGEPIAANDIGLINYSGDLRCFDLGGLASAAVFRARRSGDYDTDFLEHESALRRIRVAVLYDSWFTEHPVSVPLGGPPVPDSWIRVRRWTVPVKYQLGDRTISFYAMNVEEADLLKERLNAFEPSLPRQVTVQVR